MTVSGAVALFSVMLVLAAIPGASTLAVVGRTTTAGLMQGIYTTLGIVAGDAIFLLLAMLGLAVLAEAMDGLFVLIKYLGAAYLIGFGLLVLKSTLFTDGPGTDGSAAVADSSPWSSFLTGLLITLGDQKAVLFYLGFLPAFVDLSMLSIFDAVTILASATLAIGIAKLGYALLADRATIVNSVYLQRIINSLAAAVMIAVGSFILLTA